MLTAADDALESSVGATDRTSEADKKFREAIHLLGDFAKDFPSKDPMSDPNISGTVTREAKIKYEPKFLKQDLHAKVKFPSVSLLNADES